MAVENTDSSSQQSTLIVGLGAKLATKDQAYHLPVSDESHEVAPSLEENPLHFYTLPYILLIEAIADTLFPPNVVSDVEGNRHLLRASTARIDRFLLFRCAWNPAYGRTLYLALRDFSAACHSSIGKSFIAASEPDKIKLLEVFERSSFSPLEWRVLRPQAQSFRVIYDAVSAGLFAEPGYGGNQDGIGWYYANFMTIGA